ncbi:hypothetical protein D8674_017068 [Pyrus ussuriensis x Pyrus communis]|uniref:Uncharacterized protein n=1 Tax=Pyrus ussuriensis x Pyrus communis TaxID=2448454 RepID=A0A5N5HCQ2_9ROSA|nr:hypothetical protein D8674_017068 [Pyrus ussuriensis x Pyrus communis]
MTWRRWFQKIIQRILSRHFKLCSQCLCSRRHTSAAVLIAHLFGSIEFMYCQLLSSDELLIQNLNEEEKGDLLLNRVVPVHLMTSFHKMSEALIGSVDLLDGVFALLVGS